MHALMVIRTYLKLGVLNVVQYRANFLFDLLSVGVYLTTSLLSLAVIFGQTQTLRGWTRDQLIALVGIQILVGGLNGLVIRPSMQQLMENIRLGTLDFMLTKPADSQLLASVQQVNIGSIAEVVVGLAVILTALARLGTEVGADGALLFLVMLVAGATIVYCFLLALSTCAFWFVRIQNILVIFQATFNEAGRWPITIYPGWLRATLTFLIPVAFAVTVPAESLTGRLTTLTTLATLALALGFVAASRWFWRVGLRHYTGASA
ncbi:MAG: ABC-2 family transporter protein [Chloroflexia bacterium]|nr:ABC-2 family transporter protein [Chloroflexia bacterium]